MAPGRSRRRCGVSDLEQAAGAPELNAAAIVAALNRHQVRYVIIGAFAAIAQRDGRLSNVCHYHLHGGARPHSHVIPPWSQGSVWSRSQRAAGWPQPGAVQVPLRARIRWASVRLGW